MEQPLFLTQPSLAQADLVSSKPEVEKEFRRRVRPRQTKGLAGTPRPPGAAADRYRASALFVKNADKYGHAGCLPA